MNKEVTNKICTACKLYKPVIDYYVHKETSSKITYYGKCKVCLGKRDKQKKVDRYLDASVPIVGEIWEDVIGYEGYYKVSNLGNIVNRLWRPISKKINGKGYYRFILYKNAGQKNALIHRLVALAFIENPKKLKVVNHLDRVKTNNKASNLEWTTSKGNAEHAQKMGLTKETFKKGYDSRRTKISKETKKQIIDKSILGDNLHGIAIEFNLKVKTIKRIINGNNGI